MPARPRASPALALKCLHQEYPNQVSHTLNSDADARPPRELTPAFYGCFDWHSAVHGHWLLVRLLRLFPDAPFAAQARAELGKSLTAANIAGEVSYLRADGPRLVRAPLRAGVAAAAGGGAAPVGRPEARRWSATLAPLETRGRGPPAELAAQARTTRSASASTTRRRSRFGLVLGLGARSPVTPRCATLLASRGPRFYLHDRDCPLTYEPSGEDFLSPCLAEADFMRRVLPPATFARWLAASCRGSPQRRQRRWLRRAWSPIRADPQAGAHRRPQPEPRLDAGGHRRTDCPRTMRACAALRGRRPRPTATRRCPRSPASTTRAATGSAPSRCISPATPGSAPKAVHPFRRVARTRPSAPRTASC